ncbi:hypothetical protein SFRURICE_017002 [Spodoptera frugiperda]|nr:hypothetical protein SFRURICE_017002 [Spodoptera frugiperda]
MYIDIWIKDVLMEKDDESNDRCLKLFEVYRDILEAYRLCQKIFQILIFYHIFGAFYFGLYHLSFGFLVIRKSDYKMKALYQILVLIIWASKNIMVVIISCINCERFYKTIENVNSVSLALMQNENCSERRKHLFKKVLKLNRSFNKMLVFGVFHIDARLPMNFVRVFVDYVIVILQFNFL